MELSPIAGKERGKVFSLLTLPPKWNLRNWDNRLIMGLWGGRAVSMD